MKYGEHHTFTLGDRVYRVGGLFKNSGLDAIKVTLRLWSADRFFLDQVDLCRDLDRRRFCESAGHECRAEPEIIKRDLGKLLLACEWVQEERLHAGDDDGPEGVKIAPDEKAEAEALLRSPNLVDKLGEAFDVHARTHPHGTMETRDKAPERG